MKATSKKKVKKQPNLPMTIEEEVKLLEEELPDILLPEPIPGSPFIRKGFAECIDDKGYINSLVVGKTYKVNELHMDGDKIQVYGEDDEYHWVECKLFKAIDYGPFKENDVVMCHGFEGVEPKPTEDLKGLLHQNATVKSATDTHATVMWGARSIFKIPNENLRLMSRKFSVGKNPFHKGDWVKCIRKNRGMNIGWKYKLEDSQGDYVYIATPDGMVDKYYHTLFIAVKPKERKVKVKKSNLEDYVRKFYNQYSYEKLTPAKLIKYIKDAGAPKDIFDDEQVLQVIKKVTKTLFKW